MLPSQARLVFLTALPVAPQLLELFRLFSYLAPFSRTPKIRPTAAMSALDGLLPRKV
jgi:hypothetical protein